MNAEVVSAKCGSSKLVFGIRLEEVSSGAWAMNWAFPIDAERVVAEGYEGTIVGSPSIDPVYPGCPSCGNKSIMQCFRCRAITCLGAEARVGTCAYCGNAGRIEGSITSMQGSGDL